MNYEQYTAEALAKSIARWEDNLTRAKAGENFSHNSEGCALCDLFLVQSPQVSCTGCPLDSAGKTCNGFFNQEDPTKNSPWLNVETRYYLGDFSLGKPDEVLVGYVQEMLDILKELAE